MILIERQAAAPFFKNGFVVACERTRAAVLIDPGDEVDGLLTFADRERLRISYILLTHAHIDHVTGVAEAKRRLAVPVMLHRDDQLLYDRVADQADMFGLPVPVVPPIDAYYTPGQTLRFGDYGVTPHHTPGHCPGGVCLAAARTGHSGPAMLDAPVDLFVGDTLFAGSIGRTDLPGGEYNTLIRSIRTVLFGFGDLARVHPGHGPSTTIGQERRTNPFLR
jgi:glyoxylase-like metal-dependent hydrolase (beta-lactamase superfamily II)